MFFEGRYEESFFQDKNDLVNISRWPEASVYGEGSKEKLALISPEDITNRFKFIYPRHRYLFKRSTKWAPWQFWMEIVAYIIGVNLKVPVCPTFVAKDDSKNIYGALIEWSYVSQESYHSGGDLFTFLVPDYDRKKGTTHNFPLVRDVLKIVSDRDKKIIQMLLFDSVIGNTDRHQENWGIIIQDSKVAFSPLFDNGTSLGYNILEKNMKNFDFEKYIDKGYHHMKFSDKEPKSIEGERHFDMHRRLFEEYKHIYDILMPDFMDVDIDNLRKKLEYLVNFEVSEEYQLTQKRVNFIMGLVELRLECLKDWYINVSNG